LIRNVSRWAENWKKSCGEEHMTDKDFAKDLATRAYLILATLVSCYINTAT